MSALVLVGAVSVLGCQESDRPEESSQRTIVPDRGADFLGLDTRPRPACMPSTAPVRSAELREVAGVLPEDVRAMPGRNEGYTPYLLVDGLVTEQGGVLLLDGGLQRVWSFEPDFTSVTSWGRKGSGPREFGMVAAFALDPRDNSLVIAESAPPRLSRFTVNGEPIDRRMLRSSPGDVAVASDGSVFVTHSASEWQVERSGVWPVLVRYSPDFQLQDTLISVAPSGWGERPWITMQVETRLGEPVGGNVPVLFPYTNDLAIVSADEGRTQWTHGCLEPTLARSYRESAARDTGGVLVLLASAVGATESGSFRTFSSAPLEDGSYHMVTYSAGGSVVEATKIGRESVQVPAEVRFTPQPNLLLGFGPHGLAALLEVVSGSQK